MFQPRYLVRHNFQQLKNKIFLPKISVYDLPLLGEITMSFTADQFTDIKGLALLLHVSEKHIRKLLNKGAIPHLRVGCAYRFDIAKVIKHLEIDPEEKDTTRHKARIAHVTRRKRPFDPIFRSSK